MLLFVSCKVINYINSTQASHGKDVLNSIQISYGNDIVNSPKVFNSNDTVTTTLTPAMPITTMLTSLYLSICTAKFFSFAYRYLFSTHNTMRLFIQALGIIMEYKPGMKKETPRKQRLKQDFPNVFHQLKASLFHLWWHLGINALGRARSCCADGDDLPLSHYLLT